MKTLLDKLGYKVYTPALLWRVPETLAAQFAGLTISETSATFRVAFARTRADLVEATDAVAHEYRKGGHLWLCYPKKSGRLRSDITRDIGWGPVHALGLLGVTQVAVDNDWSALRFRFHDEIGIITRATPTGARRAE